MWSKQATSHIYCATAIGADAGASTGTGSRNSAAIGTGTGTGTGTYNRCGAEREHLCNRRDQLIMPTATPFNSNNTVLVCCIAACGYIALLSIRNG